MFGPVLFILLLSFSVEGIKVTKHKVRRLPGQPPASWQQHSGYVEVNSTYGVNLFYWIMESQNNVATDPVVLWLTGGPGCSSELAVLFENGPWTVNSDLSLKINPYSWNNNATVIYVDQPAGTGFSYLDNPSGYVTSERRMAEELYTLIQGVLQSYPQYNSGQDFFVFGESYAGHYVPAISERILMGNKKRTGVQVNMKGLAIGNGMTFPRVQYGEYASFSLSHGLISAQVKSQIDKTYQQCNDMLRRANPNASDVCNSILSTIQTVGGNFNVYDVTKSCQGSLCYDMDALTSYLNQPSVLQALGVNPSITQWSSCNFSVYGAIATPDWFNQEAYTIPVLLDAYRVMIYAGVNDWICNHQGNYKWVTNLNWNQIGNFNNAPRNVWSPDGGDTVWGYQQKYGPLSFVSVVGAGHMVPHDQPASAYQLFTNFLKNIDLPGASSFAVKNFFKK